jgi:hypothetical protein
MRNGCYSAFCIFFLLRLRQRVVTQSGFQSRIRCGAICLIALPVALSDQESNQERGASKQLAPQCGASCLLALFAASFDDGLILNAVVVWRETQLFKVVRTFRVGSRFPQFLNRRKEHTDQNGDYRDITY